MKNEKKQTNKQKITQWDPGIQSSAKLDVAVNKTTHCADQQRRNYQECLDLIGECRHFQLGKTT